MNIKKILHPIIGHQWKPDRIGYAKCMVCGYIEEWEDDFRKRPRK